MIREAFKLSHNHLAGAHAQLPPEILKVDIADRAGLSWRDAKKQLRKWYLDQAAALRKVTQKEYFNA